MLWGGPRCEVFPHLSVYRGERTVHACCCVDVGNMQWVLPTDYELPPLSHGPDHSHPTLCTKLVYFNY